MSWKYIASQWLWSSLDLLFPPSCGGCNQDGSRWCPDCQKKVRSLPEPVCLACGQPIAHSGYCHECNKKHPSFRQLRSWLIYEGSIRNAIHSLKYRRNLALGDALVRQFLFFVQKQEWPVDVVMPVPLGRRRMKERGYNQAGLIALPLAALRGWRYDPKAVQRIRETRSQVGLGISERRENVRGAFRADPGRVTGKNVLLVDDVATTGATISACSLALLEAGARDVYGITLARAWSLKDVNPD